MARARYLNTGRLSEGYRDPGLDPKACSGQNYGAGTRRADQSHRQPATRLGGHDRRRGKGLGKVQGRGLTRREGKARANSCSPVAATLPLSHSAVRRVPARRAAVTVGGSSPCGGRGQDMFGRRAAGGVVTLPMLLCFQNPELVASWGLAGPNGVRSSVRGIIGT